MFLWVRSGLLAAQQRCGHALAYTTLPVVLALLSALHVRNYYNLHHCQSYVNLIPWQCNVALATSLQIKPSSFTCNWCINQAAAVRPTNSTAASQPHMTNISSTSQRQPVAASGSQQPTVVASQTPPSVIINSPFVQTELIGRTNDGSITGN